MARLSKHQEHHRKAPIYRTVATQGPDHARTFVVEVSFADRVLGRGEGPSKRDAEQSAAADALAFLATDPGAIVETAAGVAG